MPVEVTLIPRWVCNRMDVTIFQDELQSQEMIQGEVNSKDQKTRRDYQFISQRILETIQAGQCCDITVKVEDATFVGSRLILVAVSPYFRSMCLSGWKESSENVVEIKGISKAGFEIIWDFIHGTEYDVSTEELALTALYDSLYLQIEYICKILCRKLRTKFLHVGNALHIRSVAYNLAMKELVDDLDRYISHHFQEIIWMPEFLNISFQYLRELLGRDDLERWVNFPNLEHERAKATAVLKGSCLHLIGGAQKDFRYERLDVRSKKWQVLADWQEDPSLRTGCSFPGIAFHNGELYVTGGSGGATTRRDVHIYDTRMDTWRECPSMVMERWRHGLISFQGNLYAVGGERNRSIEVLEETDWKVVFQYGDQIQTPKVRLVMPSFIEVWALGGSQQDMRLVYAVKTHFAAGWGLSPFRFHAVACFISSDGLISSDTSNLMVATGNRANAYHIKKKDRDTVCSTLRPRSTRASMFPRTAGFKVAARSRLQLRPHPSNVFPAFRLLSPV
ncbi:unnamed protein product [Darwinula stevensoni]|uniref:BTB domain-containing protein n=1 Tax=Darwinula stevensoni TaxID=69355 RepID=A0A7R9AAY0_9CRUS|nr:unnamed protein product [Darwinula stevensoni]CAG0898648.1 unnamed protein product [Darwinula stevensoni]